ncbi:MAG TPA: HAMP domain-containing sensor histidine kinase [Kofleriaceae bacterium]|nr:HAMP domain-containing sensor histidine kinase [Kofleriaceae bacterium]
MKRTLASRVYGFALAIVLVVGVSIIYLPRLLFGSRIEVHQHRTIALLADDLGRQPATEMQATLARLEPRMTGPVAIYDEHGAKIASSGEPVPPAPSADELTEIAAHGDLVDDNRLVARTPNGFFVVHQAPPPQIFTTKTITLWAVALALILAGSLLFARSLARPLGVLGSAAARFGKGDTQARARLGRRDELGDVGQAFDDMADRIEHLLRAQRDLVADVSHELRTPLARLRVALEIAADDPSEAAETLREIQSDLDELEQLVDNVLTAGRLDAGAPGALAVQRRPIKLGELANTSANRFAQLHAGRRLKVALDAPDATVAGDPVLLRRAVDNLLDNAAKYSEPETQIDLRVQAAPGANDQIEVVVADQGVGMSDDELAHAFTPFWRADASRTRGTGGVGLGLTLARRIARAHDGDIQLASRRGEGTTATLRIPVSHATA